MRPIQKPQKVSAMILQQASFSNKIANLKQSPQHTIGWNLNKVMSGLLVMWRKTLISCAFLENNTAAVLTKEWKSWKQSKYLDRPYPLRAITFPFVMRLYLLIKCARIGGYNYRRFSKHFVIKKKLIILLKHHCFFGRRGHQSSGVLEMLQDAKKGSHRERFTVHLQRLMIIGSEILYITEKFSQGVFAVNDALMMSQPIPGLSLYKLKQSSSVWTKDAALNESVI